MRSSIRKVSKLNRARIVSKEILDSLLKSTMCQERQSKGPSLSCYRRFTKKLQFSHRMRIRNLNRKIQYKNQNQKLRIHRIKKRFKILGRNTLLTIRMRMASQTACLSQLKYSPRQAKTQRTKANQRVGINSIGQNLSTTLI